MHSLRKLRIPTLLLSLVLHLAPLARVAATNTAAVLSPVVALLRWVAGATAVAGTFHAVSGATGLTITQGTAVQNVALGATGTLGGTNTVATGFRVSIVSSIHGTAKSYKASNLPTGMTMTSTTQGVVSGTPTKAGVFKAVITGYQNSNQSGDNAAWNVTITVKDIAPAITTPPVNATANVGGSATFSVVATGTSLGYQWLHAGTNVPNANADSLIISPVAVADAGTYSVVVSNTAGNATSGNVTLTVNNPVTPPTLTTPLKAASAAVGGSATFTVAVNSTAAVTYAWTKDGTTLANQTGASLTISPVTPTSAGTYTVRASNSAGFIDSSAVLTVTPVISAQSASRSVHPGDAVTLSVTAAGVAPITYAWTRNGAPLANTGASLTFAKIADTDAATYGVTVTTPGGTANATPIVLTVVPLTLGVPVKASGNVNFTFSAIAGRTYRVEFKDDPAAAAWTLLKQVVPASASGAASDAGVTSISRIYRVVAQ